MKRQRLYNPAQLAPDELKASFIARRETLEELLRVIRQEKPGRPCQHFLLIGPRGMGKTTLGLRFLLSIEDDPELAAGWQAVAFDEESYGIGDLADFWLTALHHLSRATDEPAWAERADALRQDESDAERQAVYARAALRDFCRESGKRLVLFVENLDIIFGQLGDEREVHALRASLIEHSDILLVGSANTVFEAIRGHGEPFYEFFRLFVLEGLGPEDTQRMLASFTDGDGGAELPEALYRERGRLETVRRLTGGNPRLLVLACRMLIESPLGSPLEDLERLIDEQTPFFKARIEELPVQGRRVFHCLAAGWKPMLAKEIADAAKLTSSHASAQLRQLVDKGYARELRLPRTKRVRYEVGDRFYNIYYLLRFSRAGRQRLERLVHFLHDLFGPTGMRSMYPAALDVLRKRGWRGEELSDWLGIIAGYVASDREYEDREDWRRKAIGLATDVLGADASVLGEIERAFSDRDPPDSPVIFDDIRHGIELVAAGRYADAEAAFRGVLRKAPENARVWLRLGNVFSMQGRFDEATDAFDRVLEYVRPNDRDGNQLLAIAALLFKADDLVRLKQFEAALLALQPVLEYADPDVLPQLRNFAAVLLSWVGRGLAEQGRRDEAVTVWMRTTDFVRPDDPGELRHTAAKALAASGDVLAELGRLDEALADWKKAAEYVNLEDSWELRLAAVTALVSQVATLVELERYEESASVWRMAPEYVSPDDPVKFRHRMAQILAVGGKLLHLLGKRSESEPVCRKATELDPTHGEAWRALAEAIFWQDDSSRLAEAEACARRAVHLEPENAAALHTLSDILARRGNWAEALDLLERALDVGSVDLQTEGSPGLTESLIGAVAAGHGPRVRQLLERAGLVEPMEPLWHAVRAELGEDLEPLPSEIMDTVTEIREEFAERRQGRGGRRENTAFDRTLPTA